MLENWSLTIMQKFLLHEDTQEICAEENVPLELEPRMTYSCPSGTWADGPLEAKEIQNQDRCREVPLT